MDWNVVSAIATVIGTVLTLISILVAIWLDQKKHAPAGRGVVSRTAARTGSMTKTNQAWRYSPSTHVPHPPDDETMSPYTAYLYIAVGLIGACGGVASIVVPWLLLEASLVLELILYPLLVLGIIGGVISAYLMDIGFKMDRIAPPWLRFPLCAISGVIGGWLGLLIVAGLVIGVFVYVALNE